MESAVVTAVVLFWWRVDGCLMVAVVSSNDTRLGICKRSSRERESMMSCRVVVELKVETPSQHFSPDVRPIICWHTHDVVILRDCRNMYS